MWATAPAAPMVMSGSDNDFDEVWVEPALADEVDCSQLHTSAAATCRRAFTRLRLGGPSF
jgi:hypothetical protein